MAEHMQNRFIIVTGEQPGKVPVFGELLLAPFYFLS